MSSIKAKELIQFVSAIALHHKIHVSYDEMLIKYANNNEFKIESIPSVAEFAGLRAKVRRIKSSDELKNINAKNFPFLIISENGEYSLVLARKENSKFGVAVISNEKLNFIDVDHSDFQPDLTYYVVFFGKGVAASIKSTFGFGWILDEALKYKPIFFQIAIISVILNFMAMGVPLYSQIVIDKVLSQNNMATLMVLTIGVCIMIIFELIFSVVRQILMVVITNKIDLKLSRSAFNHLMRLPIDYFEKRSVGLIARNIQQIHDVRNFLTGTLLFTLLDLFSVFIFVPVLFYYSVKLASVLLLLSITIAIIVLIFVSPYSDRLKELALAESLKQGMLIESINGIRTIKSLALEFSKQLAWESRVARSINQSFALTKLGLVAATLIEFIQKNLTVIILGVGCFDVIDNQLSVGGLIAFMMLSGRVVGGLVQMASLVNTYQQARVSMDLIAEVMNASVESNEAGSGAKPNFKGRIEFENVTFSYPGSPLVIIKNANFKINEGELIGIVGKSGSGKSTISKLIQRYYKISSGSIKFDGVEISDIDLNHLRKNIGIVMQDNFMFNMSVRDNIAISRPTLAMDNVVEASKVAGAYDFIQDLEHGFDTVLEEGGGNLSGGQRQRLGIARAVITKPKILILDEATSALDPDTEANFMRNLTLITQDKTVLIISHRLSTLTKCDRIMVLDAGKIVDFDRHENLLINCPVYKNLWDQQSY